MASSADMGLRPPLSVRRIANEKREGYLERKSERKKKKKGSMVVVEFFDGEK
jgi:hypothetical protein